MKIDKYGRAVPDLILEVHDPETSEDQEVRRLLVELLISVEREPSELKVFKVRTNGNGQLPKLDASGALFHGLEAIREDFVALEQTHHKQWVKMFPEKSKLPVFGHPYAR